VILARVKTIRKGVRAWKWLSLACFHIVLSLFEGHLSTILVPSNTRYRTPAFYPPDSPEFRWQEKNTVPAAMTRGGYPGLGYIFYESLTYRRSMW